MARKNMFEGITPTAPRDAPVAPRPEPRTPEVFQQAGPVAAMRNDLRNLGTRSVQEIDPAQIEDTGLKDRLGDLEADIADLRDSIARHGQQVPILLRPHPALSGRYQVVYGRRRLAAIRGLGLPVKALVRTLSDEEAVLAQGQENNLRKDPSFIEKALFAGDLEEAGYEARVIQDALNVSRGHTSHMRKVREAFPRALIERIGAAPSVGWKRWYEIANRLIEGGIDPESIYPLPFPPELTSDQRFDLWVATFGKGPAKTPDRAASRPVSASDGAAIGEVTAGAGRLTFRTDAKARGFADWLNTHAEAAFQRLYQDYLDGTGHKS